jgi:hypothetical protein
MVDIALSVIRMTGSAVVEVAMDVMATRLPRAGSDPPGLARRAIGFPAMNRHAAWPLPLHEARCRLARHLEGAGVELGPGHQPYPVPDGVTVRYVDRWTPEQNRELFPELVDIGADRFPRPDVVANFDVDRLGPLADQSQDFVICSHVLEHLAEPLGFVDEIHRVLRPGGVALILLPDRRATFDSRRASTPLAHLVAEHASGVTEVDDEHLLEFLANAGEGAAFLDIPGDPAARSAAFAWHRRRSIHVHCWTEEEFPEVVAHGIAELGHAWQLVDALALADEVPQGIEFGYVLRRSSLALARDQRAARFLRDWTTWYDDRRALHARLDSADQRTAELEAAVGEARAETAAARSQLEAMQGDVAVRGVRRIRRLVGATRRRLARRRQPAAPA